ncbi:MAG: hypothetical protein JSV89_07565 [Spirochaetaceae bacterium]|nr:MAG: hypothetical protein JSV89_07565 [Spirochaetaceae bacterium]
MDAVVKLHWLDYLVILIHVGFMLYIGFYFSRKRKGFEDYLMAGPPAVIIFYARTVRQRLQELKERSRGGRRSATDRDFRWSDP